MLKFKTKKYAILVSCALLSLLLLILSGCDATSDPRVYYQATGSWEGTIDGKSVRGIIAPDGSYQLAVVDEKGDFTGAEYVGTVRIVDKDNNIGTMERVFLDPLGDQAGADVFNPATFKLTGTRLFTEDKGVQIGLIRTGDAVPGNYALAAVEGRWSFSSDMKITNIVVDEDGSFSGDNFSSDKDKEANCRYTGTLELIDSTWNIFNVSGPPGSIEGMTITTIPGKETCPEAGNYYSGLAMTLDGNRLWLAANRWELTKSSTDTFFGNWAGTINEAPKATVSIVGVSDVAASMVIEKISPRVELSGEGSSDPNNDSLTYTWYVKVPGQADFALLGEGSPFLFTPATVGTFTFKLVANDDPLSFDSDERSIVLVWAPDPFVDCGNGTVLATKRATESDPYILWLKDAGCDALNLDAIRNEQDEVIEVWGVNTTDATERVLTRLGTGVCGLTDGSSLGDWRLPKVSEFEQIIYPGQLPSPPQLVNRTGTGQWSPGDAFDNVGITNNLEFPFYRYWTGDNVVEDINGNAWYFANFDYLDPEFRIDTIVRQSRLSVWPVRTASDAEVLACQSVAP